MTLQTRVDNSADLRVGVKDAAAAAYLCFVPRGCPVPQLRAMVRPSSPL